MPFWYVTSHSGQLSFLPSAGWEMSTDKEMESALQLGRSGVTLCITDSVVYPPMCTKA